MVQETMSMSARYEYIRAMRDVYLRADAVGLVHCLLHDLRCRHPHNAEDPF